MNQQKKITPHLAVCLPEIINNVISFLLPVDNYDEPKKKMYLDLHPCLFVNRIWHDCASRIIWRKAFFEDTKEDLETFLKFASVICEEPSTKSNSISTTVDIEETVHGDFDDSSIYMHGSPMIKYPSRSSSISSVSTYDSINTPSEFSMEDQEDEYCISNKLMTTKDIFHNLYMNSDLQHQKEIAQQARLSTYRRTLKSLSMRKIKEKSINKQLKLIGQKATRLEYLDVYICDHFSNETLSPFLVHQNLTYLSLAGCHHISDEAIFKVAEYCRDLEHLDLRACGLVSDESLSVIAMNCNRLKHLNVGRVRDREKVTIKSIALIAQYTRASVLGLAGCDIDDKCMETLAKYRGESLERVSVNSCFKITNKAIYALIKYCPSLSVFEMKECHLISDWEAVVELVQRKVLLTLCDHQIRDSADWARSRGRTLDVKAPLK